MLHKLTAAGLWIGIDDGAMRPAGNKCRHCKVRIRLRNDTRAMCYRCCLYCYCCYCCWHMHICCISSSVVSFFVSSMYWSQKRAYVLVRSDAFQLALTRYSSHIALHRPVGSCGCRPGTQKHMRNSLHAVTLFVVHGMLTVTPALFCCCLQALCPSTKVLLALSACMAAYHQRTRFLLQRLTAPCKAAATAAMQQQQCPAV